MSAEDLGTRATAALDKTERSSVQGQADGTEACHPADPYCTAGILCIWLFMSQSMPHAPDAISPAACKVYAHQQQSFVCNHKDNRIAI